MQFQLTDEQRALRETVRSYLRDRFGPTQVRELYDDESGDGIPPALWQALGEQAWLAVLIPEQYDGLGLGLLDAAVLAREMGAGTVPGPWLGTVLVGEALRLAGSADQQAAHLPQLAAGELKGAVALLKPGASPTPAGAPATVREGRLHGRLDFIEYACAADVLVVASDDGLYLVDPRGHGVTCTAQEALDRTTRLGSITLDGVSGERLEGSTPGLVQDLLDRAAVLVANDLVGIARKALTDTVDYDKTRVQFGRPVGSFQAVKHALADLHVGVSFAEHAATYAAHAADVDAADRQLAASVAKSKAADVCRDATGAMIQYHGGIGYTWEHDAHFYFKRCKRLEPAYGDAAQHRERIARLVIDTPPEAAPAAARAGSGQGVQATGVPAAAPG